MRIPPPIAAALQIILTAPAPGCAFAVMLRRAEASDLAREIEEVGWNRTVLTGVAQAAAAALRPRDDDLDRAREGMEWMHRWKAIHPRFNTVAGG